MRLLFDESLSPKLVNLLEDLFPQSESALRNGLSGVGDSKILEYAIDNGLVLVSTDSDFVSLVSKKSFEGMQSVSFNSAPGVNRY